MKFTIIMREELFKYVKEKFGTNPEYLWAKTPGSCCFEEFRKFKMVCDSNEYSLKSA